MKKLIIFIIVLCIGCATIFEDDFETDTIGNSPSISPPGYPPDDSFNISGPAGSIVVINSVPHGSKAVKIDRTGMMQRPSLNV